MNYSKKAENEALCKLPLIFRTNSDKTAVKTRPHRHSSVEITYIVRGSGKCAGEHGEYKLKENDVFVFLPNEAHMFEFSDEPSETLTMQTEPRYIWTSGIVLPDSPILQTLFDDKRGFENKISQNGGAARDTARLMLEAESELAGRRTEYLTALKVKTI